MAKHRVIQQVIARVLVVVILASLAQGAAPLKRALAAGFMADSDWKDVATYLVDSPTDGGGGGEDLTRVWVTADASNLYVRWDSLMAGRRPDSGTGNYSASTLFGIVFGDHNDPSAANAIAYVWYDSKTNPSMLVTNSSGSVSITPASPEGAGMTSTEFHNGTSATSIVSVVGKFPFSALTAAAGFDPAQVQPLWAETTASQQWKSNIKDRVPDAGYMSFDASSATWTAVGTGAILNLSAAASPGSQYSGGNVAYTITVQNTGTGAGTVTDLAFVMPAGFSYVSGSSSGLTSSNPGSSAGTLTWSGLNASVPASGTVMESFRLTVAGTAGTTYYGNAKMNGGTILTGDTAPVTLVSGTPPAAQATSATTPQDTPVSVTLSGTSSRGNMTFAASQAPGHGSLGPIGAPDCATVGGTTTCTASVTYTPAAGYAGTDSFTYTVDDGTFASTDAAVSLTVQAANDSPVNIVPPAQTINQDTALTFAGGKAISISDGDAGASPVKVTLSVNHGTLTLSGTTGLSFSAGTGTSDASVSFTGTLSAVNAGLNGLLYLPAAGYTGGDTLTVVTDDQGNTGAGGAKTDTDTVSIAVNAVPVITSPGSRTINEGDALAAVTATDSDQDSLSFSKTSGSLPTGISLNSDGSFAGTAGSGAAGSYSVTVQVSDGKGGTASQALSITVGDSTVPDLTDISDQSTVAGVAVSIQAEAADTDSDTLTYSISGQPTGVSINPATGLISGTPGAGTAGTFTVTVTVTDGSSPVSKSFTWNVSAPANSAPVITSPGSRTINEGDTLAAVTATDSDQDSLSFSKTSGSLPTGISLNGDGTFSGTAGAGAAGSYSVTVQVSDGKGGTASQTLSITVGDPTVPDLAAISNQTTGAGMAVSLSASATDADGDAVNYSATGLPNGLAIDPNTGLISGTVLYDAVGSHTVTVTATDGETSVSQTFTWTVTATTPVPASVTANPGSIPADGVSSTTITVQLKDSNGNNLTVSSGVVTLTATLGSLSAVTDNHDGSYRATLTAPATTGPVTVTGALDGRPLTNSATVTLTPVPGSIQGTVTDAVSHQALSGASVQLKDGAGAKVAESTSDGTGHYTLNQVVNTAYTLTFTATGYLPYVKEVTVQAAQALTENAALNPQRGSVTGTVTDKRTGSPVAGATVTLTQSGVSRTATTDAAGSYSFANVSSVQVFTVTASAGQYVTATATNQGLSPGGTVTVNLQMQPVASLRITAPADGANVAAAPLVNGTSDVIGATVTVAVGGTDAGTAIVAADGTWSFDLSAKPSLLLVGPNTISARAVDGQSNPLTAQPVSITYSPSSSLSGTVYSDTGAAVAGVTVRLLDPAGNIVRTTTSAPDGSYQFTGVPAGVFTVVVPDPQKPQPLASNQVNLAAGQAVQFDLHLAGKGLLSLTASPAAIIGDGHSTADLLATLTLRDGTPVAGTTVTFTATGGSLSANTALTGADGLAAVTLTAPQIDGLLPRTESVKVVVQDIAQGIYAEQTIIITFLPASIEGVVIDSNTGLPARGASVSVAEDFNGDGIIDFAAQVSTGSDGTYKITVPRGNWVYRTQITTPVRVRNGTVTLTSTHESQVGQLSGLGETIPASKTISGQVLMLDTGASPKAPDQVLQQGATISGEIVDQSGTPVSKSIQIGANGAYAIGDLNAGTYTLRFQVTAPGGTPLAGTTVNVSVAQDGELALETPLIDPYGTVTDASGNPISGAKLTLYWADTALNRQNGRTPGTAVALPGLPTFPPNQNAVPQYTTAEGAFAWLVFPDSDYYITAEKSGFQTYDSRTEGRNVPAGPGEDSYVQNGILHVGSTIVPFDLTMRLEAPAPDPDPAPAPQPPAPPAAAPTGLTAAPGNGRVDLTWSPVAGAQSYWIQRATAPGGPFVQVGTAGTGAAFSDSGATNGVTYYYRVAAAGSGLWSNVASAKPEAPAPPPAPAPTPTPVVSPPQPPAAPAAVTATPGNARVSLSWTPVPGARGYTVQRSTSPGGPFETLASGLTGTSYTDEGVINGTAYRYVVTAVGAAGAGAPSPEAVAQPTAPPPPVLHHTRYIYGYPDGTFRPGRSISRAEVAAILARILDAQQLAAVRRSYPDVSPTHWSAHNIALVTELGLMQGDPTGKFRPDDPITRAEISAVAVRFKRLQPLDGITAFPDTAGHWAASVIAAASGAGLVQGYPDDTYQPQQPTTRAEFVTIVNRLLGRGPLLGRPGTLWPDVPVTHWAFGQVGEASVSHGYTKPGTQPLGETWRTDDP